MPVSSPHPPAQLDFSKQHSTTSGGWSCLHQTPLPAPCRCFVARECQTVNQDSGPLPQRTSTGLPHVPSLLIIECSKASASVQVEIGPSLLFSFFFFGIWLIVFYLSVCFFCSFSFFWIRLFQGDILTNNQSTAIKGPNTPHCKEGGTLHRTDLQGRAAKTEQQSAHHIYQKHLLKHQALDSI